MEEVNKSEDCGTSEEIKNNINDEDEKKNKKNNDIKYLSANVMLEVIQKEYDDEWERNRSLESRSGMFLTFVSALIVFIPNQMKIKDFLKIHVDTILKTIPYMLVLLIDIGTIITLILAAIYFVRVMITQEYKKMSYSSFTKKNATHEEDKVSISIMLGYKFCLEQNIKVNDRKIKLYEKGIYFVLISLILMVMCFIINLFVIH